MTETEFLKSSTTGVAIALVVLPGYLARYLAKEVIAEARTLTSAAEVAHSMFVSLIFWGVFYPCSGFNPLEISTSYAVAGKWTVLKFVFCLLFSAALVSIERAAKPWFLGLLRKKFPSGRWSAGDRSPWLVAMKWVNADNCVCIVTKASVAYYGYIRVAPTIEADTSIVLEILAVAKVSESAPHKTLDRVEYNTRKFPRLIVLERSEIRSIEIWDYTHFSRPPEHESPSRESDARAQKDPESWGLE